MKKFERRPLYHYWQPKYWPTWLGIAFLRLTCLLPYRRQIGLGKAIGRLGHRVASTALACNSESLNSLPTGVPVSSSTAEEGTSTRIG